MNTRERRYDSGLLRGYNLLWDGDNRLRQVNEGSTNRLTAAYDGGGTRISKTDTWTGAHNYSWGPGGLIADSSASTTYTPGFAQRQGSTDRFAHTDWLGSTRYLSDSTGNSFPTALRFDAFGNRSATGGSSPADPYDETDFQFAGGFGYQTEYAGATEPGLGLQLLGQRYYDPVLGRFISQDPIGLGDYNYCGNDPVGLVDPSGLLPSYGQALSWLQSKGDAFNAGVERAAQSLDEAIVSHDDQPAVGFGSADDLFAIGLIHTGAGVLELPGHLLHAGEASGTDWGNGQRWQAVKDAGPDLANLLAAALIVVDIVPGAAQDDALSGCKGGSAGSKADEIPGNPFRGKDAPERAYKHLQKEHGLDPDVAGNRLHILKKQGGLGADDDVVIGRTGDVYNAATGERLGSLTDRLLGTKR